MLCIRLHSQQKRQAHHVKAELVGKRWGEGSCRNEVNYLSTRRIINPHYSFSPCPLACFHFRGSGTVEGTVEAVPEPVRNRIAVKLSPAEISSFSRYDHIRPIRS